MEKTPASTPGSDTGSGHERVFQTISDDGIRGGSDRQSSLNDIGIPSVRSNHAFIPPPQPGAVPSGFAFGKPL